MYEIHSVEGLRPTQLERSRQAAERYARIVALRERKRKRHRSTLQQLLRSSGGAR